MKPKYVVFRLKVEDKDPSQKPYLPKTIIDIEESVSRGIKMYEIKDKLFEVSVKTKDNVMVSCYMKMSYEIFRFFIRAYGSEKLIKKDFEIVKKYS